MDDLRKNTYENDLKPEGIGGWLVLLSIGVVLNPVIILIALVTNHLPLVMDGTLSILLKEDMRLFIFIVFEILGNIAFLFFSIGIIILFFRKNRILPKLLIAYFWTNLAFVIADTVIVGISLGEKELVPPELVRAIISSTIWTFYLLMSKRVKNTFVK